jgi:hypothetical protein
MSGELSGQMKKDLGGAEFPQVPTTVLPGRARLRNSNLEAIDIKGKINLKIA